ncbi:MAG: hypothetical protein DRO06_01740 [Thermoproteota archaeon]|nr:MAG: hypothetical protein DRO06_01740 [Candidatus Korarchaeota archaeon]
MARRYGRLELLAAFVGAVAGLTAFSLDLAIETFHGALEAIEGRAVLGPLDLGLVAAPALGGLISGLITWRFAPEAKGHGIPSVIEAFLFRRGEIPARVPAATPRTTASIRA